jgi:hypothetical protein
MSYWHNPLVLTRPYKPLELALTLILGFFYFFYFFYFLFFLACKISAALPHYGSQPKLVTKQLNQHHSLISSSQTPRSVQDSPDTTD